MTDEPVEHRRQRGAVRGSAILATQAAGVIVAITAVAGLPSGATGQLAGRALKTVGGTAIDVGDVLDGSRRADVGDLTIDKDDYGVSVIITPNGILPSVGGDLSGTFFLTSTSKGSTYKLADGTKLDDDSSKHLSEHRGLSVDAAEKIKRNKRKTYFVGYLPKNGTVADVELTKGSVEVWSAGDAIRMTSYVDDVEHDKADAELEDLRSEAVALPLNQGADTKLAGKLPKLDLL